jgi:cell wall-associated NlpC family hydrolase
MRINSFLLAIGAILGSSCNLDLPTKDEGLVDVDSSAAYGPQRVLAVPDSNRSDRTRQLDTAAIRPGQIIDTKKTKPEELVAFAKTQIGVPYLYGSTDPAKGFDCSGFITYVFNHFDIAVPRSSIDFTNVGKTIAATEASPGDLILFTGTDSTEQLVGHMGIIVDNSDSLRFIHSTSGKAYGVTITPLNTYYQSRYVKTVRVFPH